MKVIIPVAGFAKRMRPHTHVKPKSLIEFAGKSSLQHIMDEFSSFNNRQKDLAAKGKDNSEISEIIIITGFLKDKIEEYTAKKYGSEFKLRFIEQKVFDGPAGAVMLAESFVDEPVAIVYVDTVFEVDLDIINRLKDDEAGIIWAKKVEDYSRFGVLVLDKQGYLERTVEKPKEPISKLAIIGMYYFKDYKLLFEGIRHMYDTKKMVNGEYFLTDAFVYMMEHGAKIICPEIEGWYDTGKPETFLESHRELLKKGRHKMPSEGDCVNSVIIPPVNIADGVMINGSVIGPYVSISKGAKVTGCIVRDSVLDAGVIIENVILENTILGEETEVSDSPRSLNLGAHSVFKNNKEN